MSRGPGKIQRAVLKAVQAQPGLSEGEVRWAIAHDLGEIGGGAIRTSFYSSFQRAVAKLQATARPLLSVESRPLRSLAEVIAFYPHKSRQVAVRLLRTRFLPHILSHVDEQLPLFSGVESERYVLRRSRQPWFGASSQETDEWSAAQAAWRELDDRLLGFVGSCPIVFDIIVKGREYFGRGSPFAPGRRTYRLDRTLRGLLREFAELPDQDSPLAECIESVGALVDRWVPKRLATSARLKGSLYQIVDFGKEAGPLLQSYVKQSLLREYPDEIRALPGHAEQSVLDDGADLPDARARQRTQFSPLLDKLLQRDVLQEFRFLKPGGAA